MKGEVTTGTWSPSHLEAYSSHSGEGQHSGVRRAGVGALLPIASSLRDRNGRLEGVAQW